MLWYRVQIGAYALKKSAEKVSVDLIEKGFKTAIVHEGLLYKVRVGSFQDKAKAEKVLARVHEYKNYRKAKILEWDDGKKAEQTGSGLVSNPGVGFIVKENEANQVLTMIENRYLDRDDAHERVMKDFNALADKLGKPHMKDSSGWCTETLISAFNLCGLLDLVGYATGAPALKKNAQERGTWISGTPDHYEPGDICVYQSDAGDPNHVEISIDQEWNYTGNRNGGCHKRKKTDRHSKLNGVVRPKYKTIDIPIYDDDLAYMDYSPKIDLVAIWLSETHESKYGDAQVFIEYGPDDKTITHAILVDTGQNGCDTIAKLKKLGVKTLDAVVISHAHGDHYGYLKEVLNRFKVLHLYLPGIEGLKKYQKSYAAAIQNQETRAKKLGIPVSYMTTGSEFTVGHIECKCIYQVLASDLNEHDNHHFVNNQSTLLMFTLDGVGRVLLTGDLSNPANRVIMKKVPRVYLQADIAKCGWHGDGNAMLTDWAKLIGAWAWYWNYHHAMKKGGRDNTWKKLISAGVKSFHIYRNYEDGDIIFSYKKGSWTITKSKDSKNHEVVKSRFA